MRAEQCLPVRAAVLRGLTHPRDDALQSGNRDGNREVAVESLCCGFPTHIEMRDVDCFGGCGENLDQNLTNNTRDSLMFSLERSSREVSAL